jgi:transmembrane sensor
MKKHVGHPDDAREESGVHRLAALLRNDTLESLDAAHDREEWRRLLLATQADDISPKPRPWRRWLLVPAGVCAALLVLGLVYGRANRSPLRFTLDGQRPAADYVVSEAGRPRLLDFSDGSSLVLRESGRLRVTDSDSRGANLLLERGRLDASIHHLASSRWRVDVGPYVVQVTGTRFTVTWNPDDGDFGLDLHEGVVAIRGPGMLAPLTIDVGQRFRANRAGNYSVQRESPPSAASPVAVPSAPHASAPRIDAVQVPSASAPGRTASATVPNRPACDWAGLMSKGRFEEVVSQAGRLGIERTLSDCSAPSLFALADAARYLGNFDLSKRALLTLRKRSPGDTGKAAFFLGRLEEARGNLELALDFYGQAMEGHPESHFAQEAKAGRARVAKRVRASDTPQTVSP